MVNSKREVGKCKYSCSNSRQRRVTRVAVVTNEQFAGVSQLYTVYPQAVGSTFSRQLVVFVVSICGGLQVVSSTRPVV